MPAEKPPAGEQRRLGLPALMLELLQDLSATGAEVQARPAPPDEAGFLRLVRRRFRIRYPDGSESAPFVYDEVDREALDAVVIAAHSASGGRRVVWLRSALRPPVAMRDPRRSPTVEPARGGGLWELPAGLVEPGERSEHGLVECAARELEEEAGFRVSVTRLAPLGPSTFPSPGVIAERHFYFEVEVDPAERREPSLDGSALERFGTVSAVPLDEALAMCRRGDIEDGKTEIALRRLAERFPVSPSAP